MAAAFGGLLIQKRMTDAANLAQAQKSAQDARQATVAANKAAEDAKQAQASAEAKLTTMTGTIDDLKNQVTTLQKQATDAATALASAQANAKDAQDALDKLKQDLNGKTVKDYTDAEQKAESDLAAANSEKKIIQDQVADLQQKVKDAQDEINRSKLGTMPPGISGKVTFVDRTWNFVILNVGLTNGVVPNGELIVYRGRNFLGKVRVTKADENDAVADILPDAKGNIQVGDAVLN